MVGLQQVQEVVLDVSLVVEEKVKLLEGEEEEEQEEENLLEVGAEMKLEVENWLVEER